MRERVKTGLLLILVTISIVLTGQLLFGQPTLETAAPPAYEQLIFGDLRPIAEQLLPELRLYREGQWRIIEPWDDSHGAAWGLLLDLLRYGGVPELTPAPDVPEAFVAYALFPVAAQPALWLPAARTAEISLTEIVWTAEEPLDVWLKDGDGNWYISRLSFLPDNWEFQLIDSFAAGQLYRAVPEDAWAPLQTEAGVNLLIPQETIRRAAYSVRQEALDTDKLLRSIFVNTALVRRIEERDGAVIYTDGQRGLRLFKHGEIEYTSPKSEPGLETLEQIQALRRVAQYLQLMGGWPADLYLQGVKVSQRGTWNTHTVTFQSVQRGMRLVAAEPAVTLRFSDRGVIDYRRHVITLDNPVGAEREWIHPTQASQTVAVYLENSAVDVKLRHVYPAYDIAFGTAQPAWVFLFSNGASVVVHGYTGQILAFRN